MLEERTILLMFLRPQRIAHARLEEDFQRTSSIIPENRPRPFGGGFAHQSSQRIAHARLEEDFQRTLDQKALEFAEFQEEFERVVEIKDAAITELRGSVMEERGKGILAGIFSWRFFRNMGIQQHRTGRLL